MTIEVTRRKVKHADGYIIFKDPAHPNARPSDGYVLEHIAVAVKALGKPLPPGAMVHHHNEIKSDNRNCNLVICEGNGYHQLIHARMRILAAGGDPNTDKICQTCRQVQSKSNYHRTRSCPDGLNRNCKTCMAEWYRARVARKGQHVAGTRESD